METRFIVVLITAPAIDVAQKIAEELVSLELAACVNILSPIKSVYTWEGKINRNEEVLLIAKTRVEHFNEEFIHTVKKNHPYLVPEIIALPILDGSEEYLDWIKNVTRGTRDL